MRLPLLLIGIVVLAAIGAAILCVPGGQAIRIVLPVIGEAKPAAAALLATVWGLAALAAVVATAELLRPGVGELLDRLELRWFARRDVAVVAVVGVVMAVAVLAGQVTLPRGLALAVLLAGAMVAGLRLMEALDHEPLEVRSHWGGLGSGLGGWQVSRPAVLLVLTLALTGAAVTTIATSPGPPPPGPVPPSVTGP